MTLRGSIPDIISTRFKCEIHGMPGSGKTTAICQFPNAYIVDAERGTNRYSSAIKSHGSSVYQTTDMAELLAEIRSLLTDKHDYRTLVIDPVTPIWHALLESSEKKVGSEFGRHYGESAKLMRRLHQMLTTLDMNVIINSHESAEYGPGMVKIGYKADSWNKQAYLFDLVLRLDRRGDKRICQVVKQRGLPGDPSMLPEEFEWNYDGKHEHSLYRTILRHFGQENIERKASQVRYASPEKVKRLDSMIGALKIDEETIEKWHSKAGASSFSEYTEDTIDKAIAFCEKKIDAFRKEPVK